MLHSASYYLTSAATAASGPWILMPPAAAATDFLACAASFCCSRAEPCIAADIQHHFHLPTHNARVMSARVDSRADADQPLVIWNWQFIHLQWLT
jgi:hypothetical protein